MPKTRIRLTGDWNKLEHALKPGTMNKAIKRRMRIATRLNGALAVRMIRQTIRGGGFQSNAALTTFIKSSSKPLVDKGDLFQAVTSRVIDDTTIFVGILKTSEEFNIAMALHEGATIRVTDAMRGMFFALWKASEGELPPGELGGRARALWERQEGGWLPLKSSTTRIITPGRPFMRQAFKQNRLKQQAKKNWQQALQQAMRDLAQGRS